MAAIGSKRRRAADVTALILILFCNAKVTVHARMSTSLIQSPFIVYSLLL